LLNSSSLEDNNVEGKAEKSKNKTGNRRKEHNRNRITNKTGCGQKIKYLQKKGLRGRLAAVFIISPVNFCVVLS
jgi:hypothetical protein